MLLGLVDALKAPAQVAVGVQALFELGERERLDQVMDGSELHGRANACHVARGGDHQEIWAVLVLPCQCLACQVQAVSVGEVEVEQHKRGREAPDLRAGAGDG